MPSTPCTVSAQSVRLAPNNERIRCVTGSYEPPNPRENGTMTISERLDRISEASGFDRELLRQRYVAWHNRLGANGVAKLVRAKERELGLRLGKD
jgi:hypothetical protein